MTATVELGGLDASCGCTTSYSETAPVAAPPEVITVEDISGPLNADAVKARVDNFYIQLNNNPNAQGYIINYGTPAEIRKRRAQIEAAIKFRGYDRSRITFVDGPDTGTGQRTRFLIVPPGATPPEP